MTMKRIGKGISVFLGILFTLSVAACGGGGSSASSSSDSSVQGTGETLFSPEGDYVIVIPAEAEEDEEFASSELNYFLEMSSGARLDVRTDDEVDYSPESKFLSVGQTDFLAESGETFGYDELGASGFKVVTEGKTVFMAGARAEGTLYAVYEFLKYTVGYEFFSEDEIAINEDPNPQILDFDITEVPSIQRRSIGYKPLWDSNTFTRRLRLVDFDKDYIVNGHTFGTILPFEDYKDAHPDWFADVSASNSQPCLTNEEMTAEFVKNCKTLIEQNPDGKFLMLGQNDNGPFCTCGECTAAQNRLGGLSGLLLDFVNRVTEELDAWMAETYPGRELIYPTYAYQDTMAPPITFNTSLGQYNSPAVVPRDDVYVLITPLSADWTYSFDDPRNSGMNSVISGWGAVTSNLYIYSYCVNFTQYFIPYNNYNVIAGNYKVAERYGMYAYYEQGANQSRTTGLSELKFYLMANLMWNVNQDADALAEHFIERYYGPVSDYILDYYRQIRMWYGHLQEDLDPPFRTSIYADICQAKYWPFYLLNNWQEQIFGRAYEEIDYLRDIDPESYTKYYNRVKKENLTLIYLFLSLHSNQFTSSEITSMIDEFEYYTTLFQLNYYQEGNYTKDLIESWRKRF